MTKTSPQNKKEKFFFNVNIFDEPDPSVPEEPVFSEAELAAASQKSFAEGKREGMKEAEESRAQEIAKALEKIARDTSVLFAAETAREKTYESETVKLCLAAVQKIFPLYTEKHGSEELKGALESIIRKQEGQKQIVIQVTPDMVDGIKDHLSSLKSKGFDLTLSVLGDDLLAAGACRLSWSDGGAVRNPEDIARQMEAALRELLAGTAVKVHDSDKKD